MPEPHDVEMGSENSIIDLHQVDAMRSGAGLPPKNGALTSSIGSIMTVTTLAEEEGKVEEVGRVGGWIASFDKLLEDPLGLVCLQQYLEKEHCEENILFWKDAKEYSEKSQQMTSAQAQAAAKKIYDQYLSPSSPHTVNVDDRAMKGVEAGLANPTPNLFAEANEQIYQLVKMDCYMRFKRSDLVKECLLADMQGDPLPIGPATPITKNPWKKQKEAGFSRSLFGRFGRNKAPPSPPLSNPTKSKKDSKSQRESPSSRKSSRDADKRNSGTEIAAPVEEFPPERHLDILQTHKGDIFEVNLPNKVTKIMAVPKKGTVREAIDPVMKKNNYSLEVMDLKFADTLKPVSLESPAHILIGQHIIVLKSAQTFIATFPDGPEHILPASQRPVQELIAGALNEMGKLQKFAVYLENSRVPFSASVEASGLVGQKVTVKYLGGQYDGPGDSNMDDLFSMIERLAGDTLQDQRTSPTPRNTPEPGQLSPSEIHQRTRSHGSGSFRGPRMSPRSSDSSPEMRSKTTHRQRANSSHEKKPLAASHSIGQLGADPRGSESLRKFQRTQSGVVVPQQTAPINFKRTYSPPVIKSDRKPVTASPPLPNSRPPALPSTFHQAQQQQLRAHRSSEELIRDTHHASSGVAGPHAPKYFPRALPATDSTDSLGSSAFGSIPETLNRGDRGRSPGNKLQSPFNSDVGHPLDSFVNEASVALPSSSGGVTTGAGHGRQHSTPVQMPSENYVSSYPWRQAQPPPNPRRYTQQQTPRTAAQRHNLTQNQELMRTGDQLVQKEIEDFRHRQLTSSHSSYSDTSSTSAEPQPALSPTTTHILLPDEERQRETFV